MAAPDLTNYVEVHERIAKFYGKHPEGSLQTTWAIHAVGGDTLIIVEARAYRTADDERPGVGLASEPYPGKTPYTRDSELMNAETSAWGRAIAALGFEVQRGIASANEVRARQGDEREAVDTGEPASERQKQFLFKGFGAKRPALLATASEEGKRALIKWASGGDELTKAGATKLIDAVMEQGLESVLADVAVPTDVPLDDSGLEQKRETDDVPF